MKVISMIRLTRWLWIVLLFATVAAAQTTRPATANDDGSSKFLRFVDDQQNGGQLQTSIVTYTNTSGAKVDLIGAIHIADPAYFWKLNKQFEGYDVLLYEMVRPKDMLPGEIHDGAAGGNAPPGELAWVGILQKFMKNTLQLSHQLEEINYDRKNFVHADLDAETFFQMQDDRGESVMSLMLEQMLREMGKDRQPMAMDLGGLLSALQNADRTESARQLKLVLARQFMQMDQMLEGLDGPNGSVLVTERNKAALKVLQQELAAGKKKIGIFYGAAHLKGMEKILTAEMGFTQAGPPQWRVAWDLADPRNRPAPEAKEPATVP